MQKIKSIIDWVVPYLMMFIFLLITFFSYEYAKKHFGDTWFAVLITFVVMLLMLGFMHWLDWKLKLKIKKMEDELKRNHKGKCG